MSQAEFDFFFAKTDTAQGNVYEKRLIEAYISENGTEPTTGAPLTLEDLLDIHASYTVRPRPPELTSIPSLLGAFQQEWDALALEVFTLQQNLAQTRQELSTALYQNDAAVRVIARLTQERDAAREALRNINVSAGASQPQTSNGDAMHIDTKPLPESIIAKIESTQAGLMKTRRKRPVPAEWATSDTLSLFKPIKSIPTPGAQASSLDISKSDGVVLVGSRQGGAFAVEPSDGSVRALVADTESITAGRWFGSRCAVATSSGKVMIVENGKETASFKTHSEAVTGLALHPSGDLLASVSSDRTFAFYDLEQNELLTQVETNSGMCSKIAKSDHTNGSRNNMRLFSSRWPSSGNRNKDKPGTNFRRQNGSDRRYLRIERPCNSRLLLRERNLVSYSKRGFGYSDDLGLEENRYRSYGSPARCWRCREFTRLGLHGPISFDRRTSRHHGQTIHEIDEIVVGTIQDSSSCG